MAGMDPAVRKTTGYIAVWEMLLSLVMEAVFLVIGNWELPVLYGNLGGAVIDVTDPEPLPPDHPLWDAPNLALTPHVSGQYHLYETFLRILDIACDNLKRYMAGQPLRNVVNLSTGYRDDARQYE